MLTQVLTIIISLLVIITGLWKYFTSKEAKKQKRKEDAANEIKQGIDKKDPSTITGGFDAMPK